MTTDQIVQLILQISPAVITILTMAGLMAKTLHSFAKLKREVADMHEMKEVKSQLIDLARENAELKKKLNETLTKIDRVKRG